MVTDHSGFDKPSYVAALKYPVFSTVIFLLSSVLHAESSSDIKRFTLQREKAPEVESSHDIQSFTLQREKTPEIDLSEGREVNLPDIKISERGGIYKIKATATVNAPAPNVRYVLTDYSKLYRLNPSILESKVLKKQDDGTARVKTRIKGCAAYFCQELNRVESVKVLPSGEISATTLPEHGQFRSGNAHWLVKALGDRSEVTYASEMKPDIYIPPVVSKFLVKKAIKQEALVSFTNLEQISSNLCADQDGEKAKPSVCE